MKGMTSEWEDRGVKVHEGDGGKKAKLERKGKHKSADCHLDSPPAPTSVIKWITEGGVKGEDEGIEREHAWLSMRLHVRNPELSDMRVGAIEWGAWHHTSAANHHHPYHGRGAPRLQSGAEVRCKAEA